ncbi:hypothetical protein OG883_37215 [Streptomyces sp. NBC_01142]|uniref:hypothetical protein n=1 Tax=Streptomyces sp. NBC_01142 TaxID=2975865 RepID=UPI00225A4F62|nr:hypothetical protein [Streptomyces sp. NBC_01142]MCX4825398.1 hypothetical protein [Streptomyces sp. NBC_01142]
MLRTVEITAELTIPLPSEQFHNLHWQKKLELSLDCFICGRTGRTTHFEYGEERAVCTGDGRSEHPAAARIAGFDVTSAQDRLILRSVLDYWWAPFHDAKRDRPATALTRAPWARLYVGYLCPQSLETESFSIQSNVVRPVNEVCAHCAAPLATDAQSPGIRLLT